MILCYSCNQWKSGDVAPFAICEDCKAQEKRCTRCDALLMPQTTLTIAGIEFCPVRHRYMQSLMHLYDTIPTIIGVTWYEQHQKDLKMLAEWNTMSQGVEA